MGNNAETFMTNDIDMDSFFENTEINIPVVSNEEIHELSSPSNPYTLSLRRTDFSEEKELLKFISHCERAVRQSPEYKEWVIYIKSVLSTHTCVITGEFDVEVTIEIHHHPMSLFDITKSVVNRYLQSSKEFCSFDITEEIIEIHYKNYVGYVPLLSSMHEKYHNGFLPIPLELVSGNYQEWINKYSVFLDDDDLKRLNTKLVINKDNCGWKKYNWSKSSYNPPDDLNMCNED